MINPELQPFLDIWAQKWRRAKPGISTAQRRALFEDIAREMRLPTPVDVHTGAEHHVDSPAGQVRVRIFRHTSGGVQPALVYLHGGGWMQGSPETHWDITARIASQNQQTVISVDYAKAPEHPFPVAVQQCAAVIEWAFVSARLLQIDATRIAVGGDSAGANIAAAMTLVCRDSGHKLLAQLLVYPAVEFSQQRPSFAENADGPIIRLADMPATNAMYCPDPADLLNPLAAPLLAPSHAGLPPAFVAVAQHDPLRDDGLAYAQALTDAGVSVTLDRGEGLIHGYLRAYEYCAACRQKLDAMCEWLRKLNAGQ